MVGQQLSLKEDTPQPCTQLDGFKNIDPNVLEDLKTKYQGTNNKDKTDVVIKMMLTALAKPCTDKKCRANYDNCKKEFNTISLKQLMLKGELTPEQVDELIDSANSNLKSPEEKSKLAKLKDHMHKFKAKMHELKESDLSEEITNHIIADIRIIKDGLLKTGIDTLENLPGGKFVVAGIFALISKIIDSSQKHVATKLKKLEAEQNEAHKDKIKHYKRLEKSLQRIKVVFETLNSTEVELEIVKLTDTVDIDVLIANRIVGKNDLVKVLGRGELKAKLTVSVHKFTASAKAAIEAAGGSAVTL